MKIHYLQHVPFEGLGCIESWAKTAGHRITATRFYLNEPLPNLNDLDWLIVMGGPMNIYDDAKILPSGTFMSSWLTASSPPNRLETFSSISSAITPLQS